MNVAEYTRVFGGEGTPFHPDDVVIDVGSGRSNLSKLPVHSVVQVDPIYMGIGETVRSLFQMPIAIGDQDPVTLKVINHMAKLEADRVTLANTYRYIDQRKQLPALEQLLLLGTSGIVQIYPVRTKVVDAIAEGAQKIGFNAFGQKAGVGSVRQAVFKSVGTNTTLCIDEQPARVGPADRARMARVIRPHLL